MSNAQQDDGADLVGIPESRAGILTMLDYASLMRGLELLPHRRRDVLAHFELDEEDGQPEIDRWTAWLAAHPDDEAECTSMAERMTDYWRRWDKNTPEKPKPAEDEQPAPDAKDASLEFMAKLSAGLETLPDRRLEVFAALGAHTHDEHVDLEIALERLKSSPDLDVKRFLALRAEATPFWLRWLAAPTLSLVDYARLVLDLERVPAGDTITVYRNHRMDRVTAERELSLWKKRIESSPEDAARYAQVREQLVRTANAPQQQGPVLTAVRRDADRAPMTARAVAGSFFTRTAAVVGQPIVIQPTLPAVLPPLVFPKLSAPPPAPPPTAVPAPTMEAPPIGLLEYTVLCLQLELDEARAELHYRRLGLIDPAQRDRTHAYWQARFEVDASARQQWIDQARRLRANWQGSKSGSSR